MNTEVWHWLAELNRASPVAHAMRRPGAYATVYPLTTLLRILCAQVLTLFLFP